MILISNFSFVGFVESNDVVVHPNPEILCGASLLFY